MDTIKILKEKTDKVSSLCRNIVYALIATMWLLFSHSLAKGLIPLVFLFLVLFLFFDVLQYLSTVIITFITYRNEREKGVSLEYLNKQDKKIDFWSFGFFFAKILILITAFIFLMICILIYRNDLIDKFSFFSSYHISML